MTVLAAGFGNLLREQKRGGGLVWSLCDGGLVVAKSSF